MTNHDMGPAFGLLLAGLLAFYLASFLAAPDSGILWNRAISLIEKSFYTEDQDTRDAEQLSGTGPEINADEFFFGETEGADGWNTANY